MKTTPSTARPRRLLVVVEYVRAGPWHPEHWAADIARGLADRGHDVTVACDATHDPRAFAGSTLLVRRPLRPKGDRRPLTFQRWAAAVADTGRFDGELSLSPIVPACAWMPLGGPTVASTVGLIAGATPASGVMELLHHTWIAAAALAEWRASRSPRTLRRLAVGDAAGRAVGLGFASRLDHPGDAALDDLRRRTRRLLGLDVDRPVVLVSGVHADRAGLGRALAGLSRSSGGPGAGPSPCVLVAGWLAHPLAELAGRAGASADVRVLGATARIDALLAAADVAATPAPARPAAGTGRFIADALRLGRPVIAEQGAPGWTMIGADPGAANAGAAGRVVPAGSSADSWADAVRSLTAQNAWSAASIAARRLGAELSMPRFIARLETEILAAADSAGRRRPPGPAGLDHRASMADPRRHASSESAMIRPRAALADAPGESEIIAGVSG